MNRQRGHKEYTVMAYQQPDSRPSPIEVNLVADAIADLQYCSSCAGVDPADKHCKACTKEAKAAINAFLRIRFSRYK